MKQKILFLILILDIQIRCVDFAPQFNTYLCGSGRSAFSVNLNNNQQLKFPSSFQASFWFRYLQSNRTPLFSVNTLQGNIVATIDNRNKLSINNEMLNFQALNPASQLIQNDQSIAGNWNFVTFFFSVQKTQSKFLTYEISLNLAQPINKTIMYDIDLKDFYFTLGSEDKTQNCFSQVLYYQFYLLDSTTPLDYDTIQNLSYGFAEPMLLSKFYYEPSYNKIYSNMLSTGIGNIKNGELQNTFSNFTSLSAAINDIQVKDHLSTNFQIFTLPENMLDQVAVNNSCIFLMHYNFYFKDFSRNVFINEYHHVLYQRYPPIGVQMLIKIDFQVNISPINQSLLLRYFINQNLKQQLPFELPIGRTEEIQKIPFNFIMVKVDQNSLRQQPRVTITNGYNLQDYSIQENFRLNPRDQHVIGDSQNRDTQKKEFLTFIEILEVMFLKGSFINQDAQNNSPIMFYTGIDNVKTVLTCKNTNNPLRNVQNNPNLSIVLDSCEDFISKEFCAMNCDICQGGTCQICNPGYELQDTSCIECTSGYDPLRKVCYQGVPLDSFFETQYANLSASVLNLEVNNNYFLATAKFTVNQEKFLHNSFLFYINNVDVYNRIETVCWSKDCSSTPQQIFFAMENLSPELLVDKLLVGTTGPFGILPQSFQLSLFDKESFDLETLYYKNFYCGFLGNYFFQPNLDLFNFGTCVENCFPGYFKNLESRICVKCKQNCKNCTNTNLCQSCQEGYVLYNGECMRCQRPCIRCGSAPNICLQCPTSRMLSNGRCNALCQNKSPLCEICNEFTGLCVKCRGSYSIQNGQCIEKICSIQNCDYCEQNNICRLCKKGYTLNNNRCEVCRRNCTICPFGYRLSVGNSCIPYSNEQFFNVPQNNNQQQQTNELSSSTTTDISGDSNQSNIIISKSPLIFIIASYVYLSIA